MLTNPAITLDYVHAVIEEINRYQITEVDTIFFGGGTPTALNDHELEILLKKVSPLLSKGGEFSVECNFESTKESKLKLMKQYGVNRLSFGVQTFKESALKSLNRHHSQEDIIQGIALAKSVGFQHINIDLIYDLPNISDDDLQDDLKQFVALDVDHIATYALTIHPHTVFGIQKVPQATDDVSRRHYELIESFLSQHGYHRYEVSNFARDGHYARHNLTYWRNQPYYGIGLGASGYLNNVRYINTKNIRKYMQHQFIDQEEVIDLATQEFEYLMLNLRLTEGFLIQEFNALFPIPFMDAYRSIVPQLVERKLMIITDDYVRLTFEGTMLLDYVVVRLGQHRQAI
jgi:oxygen-independent coproporphyrinogen-3 oxidase